MSVLHQVVTAVPVDERRIRVSFENGVEGMFDCSPYMLDRYWESLNNPNVFGSIAVRSAGQTILTLTPRKYGKTVKRAETLRPSAGGPRSVAAALGGARRPAEPRHGPRGALTGRTGVSPVPWTTQGQPMQRMSADGTPTVCKKGFTNAAPDALRRPTAGTVRVAQLDLRLGRCPRPQTRANRGRLTGVRGMG